MRPLFSLLHSLLSMTLFAFLFCLDSSSLSLILCWVSCWHFQDRNSQHQFSLKPFFHKQEWQGPQPNRCHFGGRGHWSGEEVGENIELIFILLECTHWLCSPKDNVSLGKSLTFFLLRKGVYTDAMAHGCSLGCRCRTSPGRWTPSSCDTWCLGSLFPTIKLWGLGPRPSDLVNNITVHCTVRLMVKTDFGKILLWPEPPVGYGGWGI